MCASAVICGGAVAVVLVDWAACTGLAAWSSLRSTGAPERLVEQTVLLVTAATLVTTVGWMSTSLLVCTVDALRTTGGSDTRATDGGEGNGRTGVLRPRFAEAVVAAALGGVVTAGGAAGAAGAAGPARVDGSGEVDRPALPLALDGLPLPDRAYGGVRTHLVGPGESLWSITADHLPRDSCPDVVHRRWPRLHQLNLDRIGGDPHLIHPGTHLRLPTWKDSPNRGAPR